MSDYVYSIGHWIERLRERPPIEAMPTGLTQLDKLLGGGLIGSRIYTFGAITGHGKTAIGLTIGINIACQGIPTLFLTFEQSAVELTARCLKMVCGVDDSKILTRETSKKEASVVKQAEKYFEKIPFYICNSMSLAPDSIFGVLQNQFKENNIGLVVIDYIQMVGDDLQRHVDVQRAMKSLLGASQELGLPIINLAQFNNTVTSIDEISMHSLRDSSAVKQNSHAVILMKPMYEKHSWPEEESVPYQFEVAKNRGQHGIAAVSFNQEYVRFENI